MDYSELTDEQLVSEFEKASSAMSNYENNSNDFSKMSNLELIRAIAQDEKTIRSVVSKEGKSIYRKAFDGGMEVLEKVDSVTGAPARSAVYALQESENPFSAAYDQFGEDVSKAPTGKQIAQRAGASDVSLSDAFPELYTESDEEAEDWFKFKKDGLADISASGAVGLAADIALDPTNLIGAGIATKGIKKAGSLAKRIKGVDRISDLSKLGRKIGKTESEVLNILKDSKGSFIESADDVTNALSSHINPQRAKNFEKNFDIARRNKMDVDILPRSVEFGQGSFPAKQELFKAGSGMGDKTVRQLDETFRQVGSAVSRDIEKIGYGSPKGSQHAGTIIRDGFDEAIENLANKTNVTYGNIHKLAPGIQLDGPSFRGIERKLRGIEHFAKGKLSRGIRGESLNEAEHLLSVVDAYRRNDGSIKQVVEIMKDIGEISFNSKNYLDKTPKDIKKLRELYFAISKGVQNTVDSTFGSALGNELRESNKVFKQFFDDKYFVTQIGSKRVSDEALFKSLIFNGDSKKIGALKNLLSPDKIQNLKGEFLGSIIKPNKDGSLAVGRLRNSIESKKDIIKVLFEPSELNNINDLINLHADMGGKILSTSGTGSSNEMARLLSDTAKSIGNSVTGDVLAKRQMSRARGFEARKALRESNKLKRAESLKSKINTVKKITTNEKLKRIAVFSPVVARAMSYNKRSGKELKGREKWKIDGIDNLIKRKDLNAKKIEKLITSKKGNSFLITASKFKSNSRAMDNLVTKIEKYLKEDK